MRPGSFQFHFSSNTNLFASCVIVDQVSAGCHYNPLTAHLQLPTSHQYLTILLTLTVFGRIKSYYFLVHIFEEMWQPLTYGTYSRDSKLFYFEVFSVVEGRQHSIHQGGQIGLNIRSCLEEKRGDTQVLFFHWRVGGFNYCQGHLGLRILLWWSRCADCTLSVISKYHSSLPRFSIKFSNA